MENIKMIAFDLDGTLTRYQIPLSLETREILFKLKEKYMLVMVGAGQAQRIFRQMNQFPIDILGNYGMECAEYNHDTKGLETVFDASWKCDREELEKNVNYLREKYGYTDFSGDSVEYHPSGCVTLPILGADAKYDDKFFFDPDKSKRRAMYDEAKELFDQYNVFIGGTASLDIAPKPYSKYYALDKYCKEKGILHNEVIFVGDDYGYGGNDESIYNSDFGFIKIDDYHEIWDKIKHLLW